MESRSVYDELRALASGTLVPEEAAALRKRCAEEPDLKALLDEIIEIHALTEPGQSAPPPCRLSFEDMEGALAPQRAWRMVLRRAGAVAAAVLVLVGAGVFLTRAITGRSHRPDGGEAGRPLALAAIPRAAETAIDDGPEVPAVLAGYRPVLEGQVQWLSTLEAAKAVSRASSRPVLLFIHHPACCICADMRSVTFTDSEVQTRLDGFVPALVDVTTASKDLLALASQEFPWLGALDADGRIILAFPGGREPVDFADRLREAATLAGPPVLPWDEVHALVRRLEDGRRAEAAGEYAAAWRAYASLRADVGGLPYGQAAAAGEKRISARARETLLAAKALSAPDAARALDAATRTFAGSPFAPDFAAVRDRVKATGRFPALR